LAGPRNPSRAEIKRIGDALALEEGSKTGVGFGATVHAWTLEEALERKAYQPLFGNVDVMSRKKHTRSSFQTIIEIKARGEYVVYENADEAIAAHLAGHQPKISEVRMMI
jgi:stage III sporulation protein SpoIIIAA